LLNVVQAQNVQEVTPEGCPGIGLCALRRLACLLEGDADGLAARKLMGSDKDSPGKQFGFAQHARLQHDCAVGQPTSYMAECVAQAPVEIRPPT
jgi:hypothetical protein